MLLRSVFSEIVHLKLLKIRQVFDATWIEDSVAAEFITPCATFVLDHPELIAEPQDEKSQSDDEAEEDTVKQLLDIKLSKKRRYEEDSEDLDSDSDRRRRIKKARIADTSIESHQPVGARSSKKVAQIAPPTRRIRELDLTKVKLRRSTSLRYEKVAVGRSPST